MGSCQSEGSLPSRKRCHAALTTCQTTLRGRWDSDNDAGQTHSDRDCLAIHTLCPLFKPELAVRTGRGHREGWLTAPLVPLPRGIAFHCHLFVSSSCWARPVRVARAKAVTPNNFHNRVVSFFLSFCFFSFPSLSLSVWHMLMGVCVLIVTGDQRSPLSVFPYHSPPRFLRQDVLLN